MTMNQKTFILSLLVVAIFIGCDTKQEKKVHINPLNELKQVDNLLLEIAEKPQQLTVPSGKKTTVRGAKGTVLHVDPKQLETLDGSPLGGDIQIELLEMTDNASMLLNNTQTVSNGQILETGGAYYLNMTSDGKQLKMKKGKGLEVEFPRLTENEMGLFLGERDSLGQMNWVQAEQDFKSKDLEVPEKRKIEKPSKKETFSEIDMIFGHVDGEESEPLSEEELKEYKRQEQDYEQEYVRQKKEHEVALKTYESVRIMDFGWINCDRFWNDLSPKTDVQLLVNSDSLTGARIYAVFSDIKSIMTAEYWKGMSDTASFKNLPIGQDLTIIALSVINDTPLIFETNINTSTQKRVNVEFKTTTQADIKEKMKSMK
jgi:hypothetical protein